MKIYTVHINRKAENPLETANFVPEGFNWWAMIFPFNVVWSIGKRCWLFMIIALVFFFSSFVANEMEHAAKVSVGLIKLALLPFLGIWANDFWRSSLRRRGYELDSVIVAADTTEAQKRYLESKSQYV